MIGRRSLLAGLLGAPAVLGSQQGMDSMPPQSISSDPDPVWAEQNKTRNHLERLISKRRRHGMPREAPAHIATKKSWSPAFKEAVWRQEYEEFQDLEREIQDAFYLNDDPISRGIALTRLAKKLGQ